MQQRDEYLGIVEHAHRSVGGVDYCRLRPTHAHVDNSWVPVANAKASFPDQGLVFWFKPKFPVQEGTAWIFKVVEHPHYDPTHRKYDQLQVRAEPYAPTESITLTDVDAKSLRRGLAAGSIRLPTAPIGRLLVQVCGTNAYIEAQVIEGGDGWTVRVNAQDGFVQIRDIPEDAFQDLEIDQCRRRFLRPNARAIPDRVGYFDAQSDIDLLQSIVKRARKWDPATAESLGTTRQLLEAYTKALSTVNLSADERMREQARADAARSVMSELDTQFAIDGEFWLIAEELATHPTVKRFMEARLNEEVERRRSQVEQDIEVQLQGARAALAAVKEEEQKERNRLDALAAQMSEAVQQILDNAVSKLTEHKLFQALLQPESARTAESSQHNALHPKVNELRSFDELIRARTVAAGAVSVDPYVLGVTTCLIAGTGFVLIAGAAADRMATAAATLLAGGSARRVPVSSTVFGVSDLLKAPCSAIGEISGPTGSLGEFLEWASSRDHLSVVVLQGCNRAPPENSMLEFVELASSPQLPRQLSWVDQAGRARVARLDDRILIFGTLTGGVSTFPIPRSIAHRVPMVWADRQVTPREALPLPSEFIPTSVGHALWTSLELRTNAVYVEALIRFREKVSFAESEWTLARYIGRVIAAMGGDVDQGTAEALAALLAGRADQDVIGQIGDRLSAKAKDIFSRAAVAGREELALYFEGAVEP